MCIYTTWFISGASQTPKLEPRSGKVLIQYICSDVAVGVIFKNSSLPRHGCFFVFWSRWYLSSFVQKILASFRAKPRRPLHVQTIPFTLDTCYDGELGFTRRNICRFESCLRTALDSSTNLHCWRARCDMFCSCNPETVVFLRHKFLTVTFA